jgi:hypothetical protein
MVDAALKYPEDWACIERKYGTPAVAVSPTKTNLQSFTRLPPAPALAIEGHHAQILTLAFLGPRLVGPICMVFPKSNGCKIIPAELPEQF